MRDNMSADDNATEDDAPLELRGSQQRIRDAYFDNDAGLFSLNCTPGAGKSVTITDVAAEELLRRFVAGDSTPEQHICVISFTRDDAADFVPTVIGRMRELVEHDVTPAAEAVTQADVAYLADRVRRAPHVGTIDSIFREILGEFVAEVGFTEMPVVGNEGQLTRVHEACYAELTGDQAYADALDVVEAAYPPGEYEDGPRELLRKALHHCRSRRITTAAFAEELRATVTAVYDEGRTTEIDNIGDALSRCVGRDAAEAACESLDDASREELVAADQRLYDEWRATIDAFETLLEGYRAAYQRFTRERGVISHTDCAFLVAEFLAGNLATSETAVEKRERVLARYHERVDSVIIDEAQDVSRLQHAALSRLVTEECRVLAAGDLRQAVYVWRDARPALFERAVDDGQYLGIDWETHESATAATTYRCTPDIAAAINAVAEPVLTDRARGDIGDVDVTYPRLNAARNATDEASVHVAAFTTNAVPGTAPYIAPDSGKGEAGILATYIAGGLADGTFTLSDTDPASDAPTVTVLFRWRTHMGRYKDAFEAEGLTVADASQYLFAGPAVSAAIDVAEWLVDPADPNRTERLITDSELGLAALEPAFEETDWDLDAIRAAPPSDCTADQRAVLDRLHDLREQHARFRRQSAAASLADIIDAVALRADPHDVAPSVVPAQRVANLDKLVALIGEWETESLSGLTDLTPVLTRYRDNPHSGPTQPVHSDDHDVVFKTIHQMKGDESDVVALADSGHPLHKHSTVTDRLVTTGDTVGLAPPIHAAAPNVDALSVYTRGLYDPDRDTTRLSGTSHPRDVGLRWASEHWADDPPGATEDAGLAGHDHVQTATRLTRAESWRLLYVALSRARNHLVVPLPRDAPNPQQPRDRWLEPIRTGLAFTGEPTAGMYTRTVNAPNDTRHTITIAVNAVNTLTTHPMHDSTLTPTPFAAATTTELTALPGFTPRFLQPSTLHPLSEDTETHLLDHLQGRPLHTDTDTIDDDLPLALDNFDTENVGKFVHSVLTRCVDRGVTAHDLQTQSLTVERIIDDELETHGPPATESERDGLIEFLTETILPGFTESQLWQQLQQADTVIVEKPLRGHITRRDIEFELDGQADFLVQAPDGSWRITDVKITLTTMSDDTKHRYETQLACYAVLLADELDITEPIDCGIETFGATNDRHEIHPTRSELLDRLDTLR